MDSSAQRKITTLNLSESEKGEIQTSLNKISKVVIGTNAYAEARARIYSMKQHTYFLAHFIDTADLAFENEDEAFKSKVLADIFVEGIRNDHIAIELIVGNYNNFDELVKHALQKESIHKQRNIKKGIEGTQETIFQVDSMAWYNPNAQNVGVEEHKAKY